MIRCSECKAINIKNSGDVFSCNSCSNEWILDINARELFEEWARLDKADRLVAQTLTPGGQYNIQTINWDNIQRRTEIAKELREKHQHNLDISPSEWHQIFIDAH